MLSAFVGRKKHKKKALLEVYFLGQESTVKGIVKQSPVLSKESA